MVWMLERSVRLCCSCACGLIVMLNVCVHHLTPKCANFTPGGILQIAHFFCLWLCVHFVTTVVIFEFWRFCNLNFLFVVFVVCRPGKVEWCAVCVYMWDVDCCLYFCFVILLLSSFFFFLCVCFFCFTFVCLVCMGRTVSKNNYYAPMGQGRNNTTIATWIWDIHLVIWGCTPGVQLNNTRLCTYYIELVLSN